MLKELENKDVKLDLIVKKAINNNKLLAELVNNLKTKDENVRYNSYKVLIQITEQKPKLLYPYWDCFSAMLDAENTYWRSSATRLLADLTPVDSENKFDAIFEKYYDKLNDSIIIAASLTAYSGKIAKAKPELRERITEKLLDIDKTKQKHKDLMKAGAIQAFDEYFEEIKDIKDRTRILDFVKETLAGESPKTRMIAKEFLKKWRT